MNYLCFNDDVFCVYYVLEQGIPCKLNMNKGICMKYKRFNLKYMYRNII